VDQLGLVLILGDQLSLV